VIAVGDDLDDALAEASAALAFAFEHWSGMRPTPRSLETLRRDPEFYSAARDAVVAAVLPNAEPSQAAQ
jgi:hypothetical protein